MPERRDTSTSDKQSFVDGSFWPDADIDRMNTVIKLSVPDGLFCRLTDFIVSEQRALVLPASIFTTR